MAKTLVIVSHPDIEHSVVNKRCVQELEQYPEEFTVHQLYREYPDGKIDAAAEQRLVEKHENIVLQFPVYWFNCTPLLKQWFDDVLAFGWAYGPSGDAFRGRNLGIAVSFGSPEASYAHDGAVGYTVAETLRPFELTANYIQANYQPIFRFHGPDSNVAPSAEQLAALAHNAADYVEHLRKYGR